MVYCASKLILSSFTIMPDVKKKNNELVSGFAKVYCYNFDIFFVTCVRY